MARIKIDYSNLEDAAKRAGDAANEMEEYAKQLSQKVSGPVSSLTGGSTQYTTTVASLAQQKAKKLREKAGKYQQFQRDAQNLVTTAKAADKDVESYINRLKQQDSKNLTWGQKICAAAYDLYSNFISGSDVGKVLNIMVSGVELYGGMKILALKKARDFFVYGKGRYLVNVALAVLAVAGAIAAAVIAPELLIFAIAGGIAVAVKALTAGATLIDNFKAWGMHSDDPGAARYYSKTSSLNDFAKKHTHDKKLQGIAKAVDITGVVAEVTLAVGSLMTASGTVKNPDGTISKLGKDVFDPSWKTIKTNLLKEIGVVDGKFSFSNLVSKSFGFKEGNTYNFAANAEISQSVYTGKKIQDYTNAAKNYLIPIKEINKISDDHALTKGFNKSKDIKNILKHTPLIKSYVDLGYEIFD